ncbi:MAG: hypothetical protein HC843_06015 [Sphingomonadales bacterium]|nr:hypothetical protein [Sphingomonadales bacterium]
MNRLDRNMHLLAEKELDDYSFEFEGQPYAVPTVFQVWQKSPELRPIIAANRTHPDFSFVQARDADFAFQRVGARAGMVSFDGLRKSPQSHYFIRANIDARRLFNRLDSIDWNPVKWRTAGNPSIGKGELVSSYESCFA